MPKRIILLSLQQALRSVALLLFPLAFIALIAWATAGSSAGNTTDPVRAALWLWLGAHLVPFKLLIPPDQTLGALTFLPIGAAFFPWLVLRNSFRRLTAEISQIRAARIFFLFWYSLLATLIAVLASTRGVHPVWYLSAPFTLGIGLLSTLDFSHSFFQKFRIPNYLLLMLWGLGALAVGISLIAHYAIVKDLTTVIAPGWIGGVLFLLLQILYLPNLAISAISYFSGLGFSLGMSTLISPFHFNLREIPAIPLLAALPTGKHPTAIYGLALILFIVALMVIHINGNFPTLKKRQIAIAEIALFCFLILALAAFLNSGSLVTQSLTPVGTDWWKLPTMLLASLFAATTIFQYLPVALRKFVNRG
ncbi:MAG: DUF6350 family protein [Actinomycetes bacterium]